MKRLSFAAVPVLLAAAAGSSGAGVWVLGPAAGEAVTVISNSEPAPERSSPYELGELAPAEALQPLSAEPMLELVAAAPKKEEKKLPPGMLFPGLSSEPMSFPGAGMTLASAGGALAAAAENPAKTAETLDVVYDMSASGKAAVFGGPASGGDGLSGGSAGDGSGPKAPPAAAPPYQDLGQVTAQDLADLGQDLRSAGVAPESIQLLRASRTLAVWVAEGDDEALDKARRFLLAHRKWGSLFAEGALVVSPRERKAARGA